LRKLFILATLLGLLVDLAAATEALAKKQHRRRAPQAPAASSTAPAIHPSHPGGGSNSK
jgi:hypothetical protein